jgi:regulatory protein
MDSKDNPNANQKRNRPSLRSYALGLLAKREYSRKGLAAKLKVRCQQDLQIQTQLQNQAQSVALEQWCTQTVEQEAEKTIEHILDEFSEKKWLSDERFSQVLTRQKSARMGNRALSFQLKQQGVQAQTASEAIAALDDEMLRAKELIANKLNRRLTADVQDEPLWTTQEKQKLIQFLLRRGFSSRAINQAFDELAEQPT